MANADRLIGLFHDAKSHPRGPSLDRFLDEACHGDAELRKQIVSLLEAHEDVGSFLLEPRPGGDRPTEAPDNILGQYRLLERIGEGGCGVVYLAEQEVPIRRRVALKLIKRGMDTQAVIARFEAERQALALMDHPNIARVLDAGATGTGRPYFVMELVRGGPITDYCRSGRLSTRDRVALFIQVCQAVQHAHQKGIIHRDLKPSNVLVTLHDDKPVPKVIDFGIAKATTGQRLTDRTEFTALELFLGTPAYMSPEQADLSGVDVDTRTDIYSLGVLLYELLTGTPPFAADELAARGIDALLRTIRESDPPRPSTRLRHRGVHPASSDPGLSPIAPDLDWIVMKCLEKDRARRYATANGLAADLTRFLNDELVVAAAPSSVYRLRKAMRRNRLAFAAAAAVTVTVLSGLAVSLRKTAEANRARQETQESLCRAEHRSYVHRMQLARHAWNENRFGQLRDLLEQSADHPGRGLEWNYWQRQAHLELLTLRGHQEAVVAVTFSPDGQRLVSGSFDTTAKVWDTSNGALLQTLTGHDREVRAVAFSPDGSRIATASGDGTARLWDAHSARTLRVLGGHGDVLTSVTFSRDGQRLATGSLDNTVRVWDVADGVEQMILEQPAAVWSVQFSVDGRSLLVGTGNERATVWDLASRQPKAPRIIAPSAHVRDRHPSPKGLAFTAIFSPDEHTIATGSVDQTARLWSTASAEIRFPPAGRRHWFSILQEDVALAVAFEPGGTEWVTGGLDGTATVWSVPPGPEPRLILKGHDAEVAAVAFSPDGHRIATASYDHTIKLWDSGGRGHALILDGHALVVPTAAFSPDGKRVVTGSWDETARIWDTSTGGLLHLLPHDPGGGSWTNKVWEVAFSPDGTRVLTGGDLGKLVLWDAGSGRRLMELKGHSALICSVAFLRDGRRILTACGDGVVRLWDPPREVPLLTLKEDYGDANAAISPDGRRIATISSSLAQSPGGWRLFSRGPRGVVNRYFEGSGHVWDATTGQALFPLIGHRGGITAIAYSPDGRRIVTGGFDETAIVWDAANGRRLLTLRGHKQRVASAFFSADGKRILTGAFDRTSRIWDSVTGDELLAIPDHMAFALSPDGRQILTAGPPPARLINLASPEEIAMWRDQERGAANPIAQPP